VVSGIAYHPFGGVKGFTFGNGQSYGREIDLDGRIAAYSLGDASYAVGFDDASRISSIANSAVPADARSYGYDVLDRLTSTLTPSTNYGFTYDANGNRATKTVGAAADSGPCRASVPEHAGPLFRSMPAGGMTRVTRATVISFSKKKETSGGASEVTHAEDPRGPAPQV
jgi:YD repeat-containing protein